MNVKEMSLFSGYSISRIYGHLQEIRLIDEEFAFGSDGVTIFSLDESAAYMIMLRTIEATGRVKKGIVALCKALGKYESCKTAKASGRMTGKFSLYKNYLKRNESR